MPILPIEVYVIAAVCVLALGIALYVKYLERKSESLEKDLESANEKAELAKVESEQTHKTIHAVSEVEHKLQEEHIEEQAKIDAGFPRNQFDTEEF